MYFLVNASPPKRLDIATSNFADALVSSKAGIFDGVPSTEVYLCLVLSISHSLYVRYSMLISS